MDLGLPETVASRYVKESADRLNELYAAGINYGGYEAMAQATAREHEAIWEGARTGLGKDYSAFEKAITDAASADPNGTASYRTVFDVYVDIKHKGWKSPAEVKQQVTAAFNAGRGQAERVKPSTQSRDTGARGITTIADEDARLLDPATPIEELNAILARRR